MLGDSVAQPIGQLSPFSAGTTAADAVAFHRHFAAGQEAAFVQAEGSLGKRLSLMGGIRAEAFAIDGSHALEPRVSILYRLNQRQSLHASWNASAQLPPTMDLLSFPGNRLLQPITVRQTAAGMRIWQSGWGTLDAEAYTRQYRNEPVSTEFSQLMLFNMVDTLGQSIVWLPLTGTGSADSRGLEAVLRVHWQNRAQLLLSATHSRSEYRALDGIPRPGNYDTPVAINALTSFRLPRGIILNSRESFTSGRAYTPFDLPDSLAQNRGIYDLSRINAVRGPVYNRLDLEFERQFNFSKGQLEVRGGAENVMNRGNLLGYVWLQDCTAGTICAKSTSTSPPIGKVDQIGRFPVFSAQYRF
jgi:outer membrane receptor protein involved in Fe transport